MTKQSSSCDSTKETATDHAKPYAHCAAQRRGGILGVHRQVMAVTLTEHRTIPNEPFDALPPVDGPTHSTRNGNRNQRTPPHNEDAERSLIGAMLLTSSAIETACDMLTAADFYKPAHGHIFDAVATLHAAGEPVDPVTVAAELDRSNLLDAVGGSAELVVIQTECPATTSASRYTQLVASDAQLRRQIHLGEQIADRGYDRQPADDLIEQWHTTVAPGEALNHRTLAQFIDHDEPEYDWAIIGLLERTDRVLLTGPEGGGKSTLLRQIAVQCAAGIHPFTGDDIQPLTVLLLDLENSKRHIRRQLRPLRLASHERADERLYVTCHPQGLDLTDKNDARQLAHLINRLTPDLVVGGPVYKLVGGDPTEEQPAKAAAMLLDRLRVTHGFALILETHQPHETNGKRPERPYGASLWKRWPEFGLHLSEQGHLRHWRGDRDERAWPPALQRGGVWPWTLAESKIGTWALIIEETKRHGRPMSERELSVAIGVSKTTINRCIENNKRKYEELLHGLSDPEPIYGNPPPIDPKEAF